VSASVRFELRDPIDGALIGCALGYESRIRCHTPPGKIAAGARNGAMLIAETPSRKTPPMMVNGDVCDAFGHEDRNDLNLWVVEVGERILIHQYAKNIQPSSCCLYWGKKGCCTFIHVVVSS